MSSHSEEEQLSSSTSRVVKSKSITTSTTLLLTCSMSYETETDSKSFVIWSISFPIHGQPTNPAYRLKELKILLGGLSHSILSSTRRLAENGWRGKGIGLGDGTITEH